MYLDQDLLKSHLHVPVDLDLLPVLNMVYRYVEIYM